MLESGEEIGAGIVLSSADPARSLLKLVGPENLDTNFAQRIRHLRMNGCSAKIHLALDSLPESWRQGPARLVIAPSSDYVERAYDDAKYGRVSAAPALEVVIPTLHDPSLAPAGQACGLRRWPSSRPTSCATPRPIRRGSRSWTGR